MPKKPKPRKPQKIEPLFHPPYEAVRGRVHYEAHKGKEFDSNPELSEIEDKDMKKKAGLQRHLLALLNRTRGGHMFHEVQKRINGLQESPIMSDQEVEEWYRFIQNAVEDAKMSARNNPRGFRYASASKVAVRHLESMANVALKDAPNRGEWWKGVSDALANYVSKKSGQRVSDVVIALSDKGFKHNWYGTEVTLETNGDRVEFLVGESNRGRSKMTTSYTTKKMIKVLQQTYRVLN